MRKVRGALPAASKQGEVLGALSQALVLVISECWRVAALVLFKFSSGVEQGELLGSLSQALVLVISECRRVAALVLLKFDSVSNKVMSWGPCHRRLCLCSSYN
jgi:hypothetical protein